MTRDELLAYLELKTGEMIQTAKDKNDDYTGGLTEDALHNFTRVEALGIATAEVGILCRMTDKFARTAGFFRRGKLSVTSETIEDTLIDLANYALILAAMVSERKKPARKAKKYAEKETAGSAEGTAHHHQGAGVGPGTEEHAAPVAADGVGGGGEPVGHAPDASESAWDGNLPAISEI